jgi:ubiquinone/menaquinone biosynthesis C-methylase UbiE
MPESFDDIQKKYYKTAEIKRFQWQTENVYIKKKEIKLLEKLVQFINPEDSILEAGCGEAANIINLRASGIVNYITAIDFSETKIKFCNSLNISNTNFVQADARNLPFEDNTFDITFARDLLHHVNENREEVINEMLRVTKASGRVIILEGNGQKPTNYIFATIFPQEKGMKDSTYEKLTQLIHKYNGTITPLECCNTFRLLLHYNMGMPYLSSIKFICHILDKFEDICINFLPHKFWAYWFINIQKNR